MPRISPATRISQAGKLSGIQSGRIGAYKTRDDILREQQERQAQLLEKQRLEKLRQAQLQQQQEIQKQKEYESKVQNVQRNIREIMGRDPYLTSSHSKRQVKELLATVGMEKEASKIIKEANVQFSETTRYPTYSTYATTQPKIIYDPLGQPMTSTTKEGVRFSYDTSPKGFTGTPINIPTQKSMIEPSDSTNSPLSIFTKQSNVSLSSLQPKQKTSTGGAYFMEGEAGLQKGEVGYLPSEKITGQTKSESFFSLFPENIFGNYEKTPTRLWLEEKGTKAQEWLAQKSANVSSRYLGDYEKEDFSNLFGYGFYKFRKGVATAPFSLASFGVGILNPKKETKKVVSGFIDLPSQVVKDPVGVISETAGNILGQSAILGFGTSIKAKPPTTTEILGFEQIRSPTKVQTDIVFKTETPKNWGRVKTEYGQARSVTNIKNLEGLQKGDTIGFGFIGKKSGSSVVPKKQFQFFEQTAGKESIIKTSKKGSFDWGDVIKQSELEGFNQLSAGRVAVSKGRRFKSTSRGFEASDLIQDKYLSWGKGANVKQGSAIVGRSLSKSELARGVKPSSYRGFIFNLKKPQGSRVSVMGGSKAKGTPLSSTFQTPELMKVSGAVSEAVKLASKTESKPFGVPTPSKSSQQFAQVQKMKQNLVQKPQQVQRDIVQQRVNLKLFQPSREKERQKTKLNLNQISQQSQQFKQVQRMKQEQLLVQKQKQKQGMRQRTKQTQRIMPRMMPRVPRTPRYAFNFPTEKAKPKPLTKGEKNYFDIFLRKKGRWVWTKRVSGTPRTATYWGEYLTEQYLPRSFRVRKVGERDFYKLRMIGQQFRRPVKKKGQSQDLYTAIEKTEYSLKEPFEKIQFAMKTKRNKNQFLF